MLPENLGGALDHREPPEKVGGLEEQMHLRICLVTRAPPHLVEVVAVEVLWCQRGAVAFVVEGTQLEQKLAQHLVDVDGHHRTLRWRRKWFFGNEHERGRGWRRRSGGK